MKEMRTFFNLTDLATKFKSLKGKFRAIKDKDEEGRDVYCRRFKYPKLVGAIIIDGKYSYKVITTPDINGEQLMERKIRR